MLAGTMVQIKDNNGKKNVSIVTDTATSLSDEMVQTYRINVAPMGITIDGVPLHELYENVTQNFYKLLETFPKLPTTTAPKPESWLTAFVEAANESEAVFCITLASDLSGSYESALQAKEIFSEKRPNVTVEIFDSRVAAGSQALVVLECARMALRGVSLSEIRRRAEYIVGNVRLLAYLDTLEYVYRGGRVPRIALWASSLFNIKPIMEFAPGRIGVFARPRSRKKALNRIISEAIGDLRGKVSHVNIMHSDAELEALELRRTIDHNLNCKELFVSQFPPFMGVHTGPGLVGISYWMEE